jgi:pentatricopeptide repeat protein
MKCHWNNTAKVDDLFARMKEDRIKPNVASHYSSMRLTEARGRMRDLLGELFEDGWREREVVSPLCMNFLLKMS